MDVLEGGVPPGTRGGRTWGGIRSIPTVNLPLSVPYAVEAVEQTLGPVEVNGNDSPKAQGQLNPVPVQPGAWARHPLEHHRTGNAVNLLLGPDFP